MSNGAIGRIFPATPLTALSAAADREGSGDFLENKTVGLYIQEQLAFGDNFFITGAIRADDNSAFGAEFDRATYPKLSATWTLEEPFAVAPGWRLCGCVAPGGLPDSSRTSLQRCSSTIRSPDRGEVRPSRLASSGTVSSSPSGARKSKLASMPACSMAALMCSSPLQSHHRGCARPARPGSIGGFSGSAVGQRR